MGRWGERLAVELTTVADDGAQFHQVPPRAHDSVDPGEGHSGPAQVVRLDHLTPDSDHTAYGHSFRTLPRPGGERLATVATVNDLHIGEVECGRHEAFTLGPVLAVAPGARAYPELMAAAAAAEIELVRPDAVVAKGDITAHGRTEELDRFLAHFGAFDGRLHWVRGNHDAPLHGPIQGHRTAEVNIPGVTLALLDTAVAEMASGRLGADQLEWLDELGARADRPVMVMGHHHPWHSDTDEHPSNFFGLDPDDSEALVDVFARRAQLVGYFAGHTHRNRVRRFAATGDVPWVEVGSTKDFPGGWAEYRVYEGGILQVFHRSSDPEALEWSDRTRTLFGGLYPAYSFGTLGDRCLAVTLSG